MIVPFVCGSKKALTETAGPFDSRTPFLSFQECTDHPFGVVQSAFLNYRLLFLPAPNDEEYRKYFEEE